MDTRYLFLHIPDSIALDNNKSARDNTTFVTEEVAKLINKGCVSPVTVAHNKGSKLRLVLDARHINPHLYKFKHKYEDAVTARQLLLSRVHLLLSSAMLSGMCKKRYFVSIFYDVYNVFICTYIFPFFPINYLHQPVD
jgi:hypothetical protein